MVVKRSIQMTVLKVALFILAALVTGKYILVPATRYLPENTLAFILGATLLMTLIAVTDTVTGRRVSRRMAEMVREIFPKTADEMREIGIESELDFAFAMMETFTIASVSVFTNTISKEKAYYNRKLFNRSIEIFEEMFERKPESVWSLDWRCIARSEAIRAFGKNIPYSSFRNHVSLKVRRYYDNEEYLKKGTCNSEMNGGLQK